MAEEKSKYEEIAGLITREIEQGKFLTGDKIYSENEMAGMFGVSRQTARHAVYVLEQKGLVKRRRGSGTYVKNRENSREDDAARSMRIAVMTTYVDEYIFPNMLKEMENRLSGAGYSLQISFTHNTVEKERMILKGFLKKGSVDGIIAEPIKSGLPNPNLDIYRELQRRKIPLLFLDSYYPELSAVHISMDDYLAGKMVTEHLLQCGHRKIAAVFKSDDGQGHKRYAGYMDALMQWDIKVKSERIAWIDTCELKEMKMDSSRYLRRLKGCTACVCYNDEVANQLVGILKEAGMKIPQDFSIVGIDNSELAGRCEIPLTSAQNPVKELAGIAAVKMLELLAGLKDENSIELKPRMIIRKSVRIL
jgi:GntR family transcriptional regulator of arabinose operon